MSQATGTWREVVDRLQQRWTQLTDDDVAVAKGTWDELVTRIANKTGEARSAVNATVRDIADHCDWSQVKSSASEGAHAAFHAAGSVAQQAGDLTQEVCSKAWQHVRRRPGETMALVLGIGFLGGWLLCQLRRNERE